MTDHTTEPKQCSSCKEYFPRTTEYFYKRKDSKDGLRTACITCMRKDSREYAAAHPEEARERQIVFKQKNPGKQHFYTQRWKTKYPGRKAEHSKKYREKHSAKVQAYGYKYRADHPEIARARSQRRRARKRGAEGSHTLEEVEALYHLQQGRCFHCDADISTYYEEDHWIPLSRGGSHWISNIRLLCRTCNRSKGDKFPHEWRPDLYS